MIYIENEGALFRGPSRAWPREVWDGNKFVPYEGSIPKDIDWGQKISEEDASKIMNSDKKEVA